MKRFIKTCLAVLFLGLVACGEKSEQTEEPAGAKVTTPEGVSWAVPNDWITEPVSSSFRKAQYKLPMVSGDPEDGECIVYYFGGEGGGVQSNLDRWCSQFVQPDGRPSQEVAEIDSLTVNGLSQTRLDVSGTYLFQPMPMASQTTEKPGFRMLASIVETSSGPWFVKCVGPQNTMAKWQDSVGSFMDSFSE